MKKEVNVGEIYNNHTHDAMIFPFIDRIFNTDIRIYLSCTPQATKAMVDRLFDFLRATGLPLHMKWYYYLVGKIRNNHGCMRHHDKYGFYMRREVYWWNLFMLNFATDCKKTEQDLLEKTGNATPIDIIQEYSKNVWYTIDTASDEELQKRFSNSFPEMTENEQYLECFCGNCMRERVVYNVYQQY